MMKNMQWRLGLIAVVIGLSVWAFYPPGTKVKLGLDLKGGVHLVLRVQTDDALKVETETTVERLRDTLTRAGVAVHEARSHQSDRVPGRRHHRRCRRSARRRRTPTPCTTDRPETGGYTYRMKPNIANQLRDETVTQALRRSSAASTSWAWPSRSSRARARRDQILVQLPGVSDVQRAKDIIRSTAQLELRLVEQGPFPSREAALQAFNNALPPDSSCCRAAGRVGRRRARPAPCTTSSRRCRRSRATTCATRSSRSTSSTGRPFSFTLKQDAAARFGSFTEPNIGRPLAIILDSRVMSVATIQGRITDSGQISGHHARRDARPVDHAEVGRAAGVDGLPRRADGRAVARRRTRFAPASRRRSAAWRSSSCSCCSTTS